MVEPMRVSRDGGGGPSAAVIARAGTGVPTAELGQPPRPRR